MIVYKLSRLKWAGDIDAASEGSRLNGGRWNKIDIRCIYTSENRALNVLEYSCHCSLHDLPRALSFTLFNIPDHKIYVCPESRLPGNWKTHAHTPECRNFGTNLLIAENHLVVKIPSVVLPYEFNYLINPNYPDFASLVTVHSTEDYSYDIRIKV